MPAHTDAFRGPAFGVGWGDDDDRKKGRLGRRPLALLAALLVLLAVVPAAQPAAAQSATSWIVRALPGQMDDLGETLSRVGATSILPLPLIDGYAVDLTSTSAAIVAGDHATLSLTPDATVTLTTFESGPPADGGALHRISRHVVRADVFWNAGYTGEGVDIAVIDSGIAPVPGLDDPTKVVNGPDLSFDGPQENLRHLDLFGHGTHMSSIIAGSDLSSDDVPTERDQRDSFLGIAPGARIVNVKVADAQGLADVSQVIAAIGWVVDHRDDPTHDLDIRVLGLAFGTDSTQPPEIDPLAYAVEQAWNAGIVVVTSSGNDGNEAAVRNPASHPYVIAVGGADAEGTYGTGDDTILPFSNCGTERTVDIVAPGASVLGLRVPGSHIDAANPSAVAQGRLFRGSGTSQASAIVTGAAALVIDQRPDISPDEVKALLTGSANPIRKAPAECQGAGMLDLSAAFRAPTPAADHGGPFSTGVGSLEASRGSHHVQHDGVVLEGEIDIFGEPWTGASWSDAFWSGASWSGASWSGASWSGASWSGASWSGASWSVAYWS